VIAQTPGSLDQNFDSDGRVTVPFATGDARGYSVVESYNNEIYVVGDCATSTGRNIALARILPDGSLDQGFDGEGKVLASDLAYTVAYGAVREAGGKVIVTGHSGVSSSNHRMMVARINTSGSLDNTFGNGGFITTEFASGESSRGWDVALQTDGKIVVAGRTGGDIAVARYLSNGTLDNTFSSDGKIRITHIGFTDSWAHAIALTADDKIVVVGTIDTATPAIKVVRLNTDGTLDNSFGFQGQVITLGGLVTGDANDAWDVVVDSQSRIVVAGTCGSPADSQPFLIRINPDGSNDIDFDFFQNQSFDIANINGGYYSILQQTDGKYACAGKRTVSNGQQYFLVSLVNEDGTMDTNFSTSGYTVVPFGYIGAEACARDIRQQDINGANLLTVAGYGQALINEPFTFCIARFYTHLSVGIIDFAQPVTGLLVYPNPITESTTLTYTLEGAEQLTISLVDLQGHLVLTYLNAQELPPGEHKQEITMPSDLASGNYMLVLSSPNGKMSVQVTKQ